MNKSEESSKTGKEIKGYRILKPIGQGKFSIVYKAERVSDNLPVAMKIIKVNLIRFST
jgi:serine/threonine protein kinase